MVTTLGWRTRHQTALFNRVGVGRVTAPKNLQGDLSIERWIPRAIDVAKLAAAHLLENPERSPGVAW